MRCGGCGGKIGANILSAALQRLHLPMTADDPRLETPDDAAILDRHAARWMSCRSISSAFLDDPYLWADRGTPTR